MRRAFLSQLALLLIASAIVAGSASSAIAAKKCITIGAKSICFDDGKGKTTNDDADNDGNGDAGGGGNKPQPTTGNKCQGEITCPPGYVVLDKPNKYGACCEPKEGFCPPDRPVGTPPNCCAEGTTFREGACWPTNCGPGTVGTPPHCQRICAPGKILVGQTCYDPCPAGTTGTPPNCFCPKGQDWDDAAKACKERPKCTGGMVGTPPNCKCPAGTLELAGTCQTEVPNKACPRDTLLFSYGGEAGCIDPKTKKVVVKCFRQKTCPSGWRGTGLRDERGLELCCMPPPEPVFGTTPDFDFLGCWWDGTAPFCEGRCPAGTLNKAVSRDGKGMGIYTKDFGKPCVTGFKVLCCESTLPKKKQ